MECKLLSKNPNGFTLVELAIVLMIIGLLIGGILRGQEMMENARITKTIQQVKSYEGAIVTFRDLYAAIPGDMPNAISRLPGCINGNSCLSGNGDGMIDVLLRPWDGTTVEWIGFEKLQFWKQLALAHLITGVNPATSVAGWGISNPTSSISGGFHAIQSTGAYNGNDPSIPNGLILRPQVNITGDLQTTPPLNAQQASQIDRKMDDGIPLSGNVRAMNFSDGGNSCTSTYKESVLEKKCVIYFLVQP